MQDNYGSRKIIHIDMDAFYAAVEELDNPLLRGKPIAVGRSVQERGVLSTANYEARKYGVHSAMSTAEALQLCPHLVVVPGHFERYHSISRWLQNLYATYTDIVEPIALDECYLDVTKKGSAKLIAKELKYRIKMELGLTASVGVSCNKLIAKIASDYKKPNGYFVVQPNEIPKFIYNVRLKDINGVGKETIRKVERLNLGTTCGDLQRLSIIQMTDIFGSYGQRLYYFIRGFDDREVISNREHKSIGAENTFLSDIYDIETLIQELTPILEEIIERATESNTNWKTITIKVKYIDFVQITRSRSFNTFRSTIDIIEIEDIVLNSKIEFYRGIRLAGLTLSNFKSDINQLKLTL